MIQQIYSGNVLRRAVQPREEWNGMPMFIWRCHTATRNAMGWAPVHSLPPEALSHSGKEHPLTFSWHFEPFSVSQNIFLRRLCGIYCVSAWCFLFPPLHAHTLHTDSQYRNNVDDKATPSSADPLRSLHYSHPHRPQKKNTLCTETNRGNSGSGFHSSARCLVFPSQATIVDRLSLSPRQLLPASAIVMELSERQCGVRISVFRLCNITLILFSPEAPLNNLLHGVWAFFLARFPKIATQRRSG